MSPPNRECLSSTTGPEQMFSRRSILAGAVGLWSLCVPRRWWSTRNRPPSREYQLVEIPQNGHLDVTVDDSDTLSDLLIDISATGATFHIDANGSDWEIKNVGVTGVWDVVSEGHEQAIAASVDDGGTGLIDGFYFGDGVVDDTYPGVTGIYVRRTHAGSLRINNVNIQETPNNAIYASTPGYPEDNALDRPAGGQGVVEITNSFARGCLAAHFRLGTDGSFVRNSVAVGGDRGVWARFNRTEVIDCDLSDTETMTADGDVVCGTNNWPSGKQAILELENTVYESTGQDIAYDGTILGESADRDLRTGPPESVPRDAKSAATGSTGNDQLESRVTIEFTENSPWVSYEFTAEGDVSKATFHDDSDEVVVHDGVSTVRGVGGKGGKDIYWASSSIRDWKMDADARHYAVSIETSVGQGERDRARTFTIRAGNDVDRVDYSFVVDGEIRQGSGLKNGQRRRTADGLVQADGSLENGGVDTYLLDGVVGEWRCTADPESYQLFFDGTSIEPAEIAESP